MTDQNPFSVRFLTAVLPLLFIGVVALGAGLAGGFDLSVDNTGHCKANPQRSADLEKLQKGWLGNFVLAEPRDVTGLSFRDLYGKERTLADFRGKTVLVTVWAEWCGICRKTLPGLKGLQEQLGGRTFDVVVVNVDDPGEDVQKAKAFIRSIGAGGLKRYGYDGMGPLGQFAAYGVRRGVPASILVDRDGCLIGKLTGGIDWADRSVIEFIKVAKKFRLPPK